jgi:hypothetical protein
MSVTGIAGAVFTATGATTVDYVMAGSSNIAASVTMTGKVLGEDWIDVEDGTETWTEIAAGSEIWSQVSTGSEVWLQQ